MLAAPTTRPARVSSPPRQLPQPLRRQVERRSGVSLGDVAVHHDSPFPGSVGAEATTYGSAIHVAPGGERHLGEEAWHAVQQKQGRALPQGSLLGIPVNRAPALESEATALARPGTNQRPRPPFANGPKRPREAAPVLQLAPKRKNGNQAQGKQQGKRQKVSHQPGAAGAPAAVALAAAAPAPAPLAAAAAPAGPKRKRRKKKDLRTSIVPRDGGFTLKVTGRPRKWSTATLKALAEKFPGGHAKGTTLKPNLSRNHMIPWQTQAKEPRTATRAKSLPEHAQYLREHEFTKGSSHEQAFKAHDAKTGLASAADIEEGHRIRLLDVYNKVSNLYLGKTRENSSGGSIMGHEQRALSEAGRAKGPFVEATHKEHLARFEKAGIDIPAGTPGEGAKKAGFKATWTTGNKKNLGKTKYYPPVKP